jgi:hypothetical protein
VAVDATFVESHWKPHKSIRSVITKISRSRTESRLKGTPCCCLTLTVTSDGVQMRLYVYRGERGEGEKKSKYR